MNDTRPHKIPVENGADQAKLPEQENHNYAAGIPPASGFELAGQARTDLVLIKVQIGQAITMLRALRDALPVKLAPEARAAMVTLLTAGEKQTQALTLGATPRNLLDERIVTLQQRVQDLDDLLDALPLKFPTPGADRAFCTILREQIIS